jgi:hypothetical protein
MAQEVQQKVELPRRQVQLGAVAPQDPAAGIDFDIVEDKEVHHRLVGASQDGSRESDQLSG